MNKYATEGVNPATAEAQQRLASFAETLEIVGAQHLEFIEYGEGVNHFWREAQDRFQLALLGELSAITRDLATVGQHLAHLAGRKTLKAEAN